MPSKPKLKYELYNVTVVSRVWNQSPKNVGVSMLHFRPIDLKATRVQQNEERGHFYLPVLTLTFFDFSIVWIIGKLVILLKLTLLVFKGIVFIISLKEKVC